MWGVVGKKNKYEGVVDDFFPFRPPQDLKWNSPYRALLIIVLLEAIGGQTQRNQQENCRIF